MATDFTEETAADAVVDSFAKTPDPRLRELLSGLVRHLHAFVRGTESPTFTRSSVRTLRATKLTVMGSSATSSTTATIVRSTETMNSAEPTMAKILQRSGLAAGIPSTAAGRRSAPSRAVLFTTVPAKRASYRPSQS